VDRTENEAYFLSGFKTFTVGGAAAVVHGDLPERQHPIQGMWWGDYTAKPAHQYEYTVVPVYGSPKNCRCPTQTRPRSNCRRQPRRGHHGVYFNRGVAASQAYATKFGAGPDSLPPDKRAEAMTWPPAGCTRR